MAQVIHDMAEIRGDVQVIGGIGQRLNEVAVLDFNGNGRLDLFVGGIRHSDPEGVYGFFDVEFQHNQVLDLADGTYDFHLYGDSPIDIGGWEVIDCDINADGIGDIATYEYLNYDGVRIVFGSTEWLPGAEVSISETTPADLTITGSHVGNIGEAMVSADINDDGFEDLIVGSPDAIDPVNWSTGAVFVFLASPEYVPPMTIDLDTDSADITIYGAGGAGAGRWQSSGGAALRPVRPRAVADAAQPLPGTGVRGCGGDGRPRGGGV